MGIIMSLLKWSFVEAFTKLHDSLSSKLLQNLPNSGNEQDLRMTVHKNLQIQFSLLVLKHSSQADI